MSDQHTPGPWHWDSDAIKGDQLMRVRYRVTAIGKTVTQCYYSSADPQAEWDARLIAAAPELLAACSNARDIIATDRQAFVDCQQLLDLRTEDPIAHGLVWVADGVWIAPEDAEPLRDYDRALALIGTAIAKATGSAA